jgi:hypothetical protein
VLAAAATGGAEVSCSATRSVTAPQIPRAIPYEGLPYNMGLFIHGDSAIITDFMLIGFYDSWSSTAAT